MSNVPEELRYTPNHEWVRINDNGTVTVGITDHAQHLLGDLVYVEVPQQEGDFTAGDDCAVVESVKAASDVYCPVSGEIVESNPVLAETPELINQDPYGEGWIFKIKPADEGELEDLLDAEAYAKQLAEDDAE